MEHNPELIRAWNDYAAPLGLVTPEVALPIWNAFKAGWEARLKSDIGYEAQGY